MRRRHILWWVCAAVLAGCAATPERSVLPSTVPRARIDETAKIHGESKADFFVVTDINAKSVRNSLDETFSRNQGRGRAMTPYFLNQDLPVGRSVRVGLMARTHYAAPILALANDVYLVRGMVEFTPREHGRYIVRGVLGDNYSAVWIEDRSNDQVVGQKIEIKGNAKAGLWDK